MPGFLSRIEPVVRLRLRARTLVRGRALSGNPVWTFIGVALFARRLIRRWTGAANPVVFSHELRPGDSLVIAQDREAVVRGGRRARGRSRRPR
jgi:molybdopterin biosynthesis enzyme